MKTDLLAPKRDTTLPDDLRFYAIHTTPRSKRSILSTHTSRVDACATDGEKMVTAALGYSVDNDEHDGGDGKRATERLGYRGHTRRANSNESSGRFDGNFSTVFRAGSTTRVTHGRPSSFIIHG